MKVTGLMPVFAITADQRRSRRQADAVPRTLETLAGIVDGVLLGFERTAGDEIQGLLSDPGAVVRVLAVLLRSGQWRIGVGIGPVEAPLPDSTRAARGVVYLAARAALDAARGTSLGLAVRDGSAGTGPDDPQRAVWQAETALLLWGQLLGRRSAEGWAVSDLLDRGLTNRAAAAELGISPSAASQRAARAAYAEARRGARLAVELLSRAASEGARP